MAKMVKERSKAVLESRMELKNFFKKQYGHLPAFITQAPGRLELLGNHTDYNEGLVMALAIDRYIYMAASPRLDGCIELSSTSFPQNKERFMADRLEKNPQMPWADYIKGVLLQLRNRNIHFGGCNIAIHGTIPMGAGMSSSAALEVATALTIHQLYPFKLKDVGLDAPPLRDQHGVVSAPLSPAEKMQFAKLCQAAENRFVGVGCGLLDQISSLYGKSGHVIQIDCQDLKVDLNPMAGGTAIVVCNSGVKHALVGGEYNELRSQCESAAKKLGVKALRRVDPEMLASNKNKLTDREYQCASHIVGENQRVVSGEKALNANDIEQFGQYLYQSHESSRHSFHNSCEELDILVDLARLHPGCLGARLTGGGFGGATINLVRYSETPGFLTYIAESYTKKTGHLLQPIVCQVVDGAASGSASD
jgi:galactokinase